MVPLLKLQLLLLDPAPGKSRVQRASKRRSTRFCCCFERTAIAEPELGTLSTTPNINCSPHLLRYAHQVDRYRRMIHTFVFLKGPTSFNVLFRSRMRGSGCYTADQSKNAVASLSYWHTEGFKLSLESCYPEDHDTQGNPATPR